MRNTLSSRFLDRLWEIQGQRGFTNVTLARMIGVSQSYLSRLKTGKRARVSLEVVYTAACRFPELAVFLTPAELTASDEDVPSRNGRKGVVRVTVAERLERLSIPEPNSGCTLWLGSLDAGGYGKVKGVDTQAPQMAHRVAYETFVGPIPEGLQIDHLCRNRACINPQHLEPVTPLVNMQRSLAVRGRLTACKRGHPFDTENTYRTNKGGRVCRTCNLAHHRAKQHGIPLTDAMQVEARRYAERQIRQECT